MTSSKISKFSNRVENWYRDGIRYVDYENKGFPVATRWRGEGVVVTSANILKLSNRAKIGPPPPLLTYFHVHSAAAVAADILSCTLRRHRR